MTAQTLKKGTSLQSLIYDLEISLETLRQNHIRIDLKRVQEDTEEHENLKVILIDVFERLLAKAKAEFESL
jgi:hypothetical protein